MRPSMGLLLVLLALALGTLLCYSEGLLKLLYNPHRVPTKRERRLFTEALGEMLAAMREMNVPVFLVFGTLLGTTSWKRSGDFIYRTMDLDLAVDERHVTAELLARLLARLRSPCATAFIHDTEGLPMELKFVGSNGTPIDLFILKANASGGSHYFSGIGIDNATHYTVYRWVYPRPEYTLCLARLQGLSVWVPCDPESFLSAVYGPAWATPEPVDDSRWAASHSPNTWTQPWATGKAVWEVVRECPRPHWLHSLTA